MRAEVAQQPVMHAVDPAMQVQVDAARPGILDDRRRRHAADLHLDVDLAELLEAVRVAGVSRLAIVGGAGSLRSPAGGLVADGPNFPEVAKAEAAAGKRLLDRLQTETAIDWTFLSPAAVFTAGERTGAFRLGDDDLLIGADGKSAISFEDFAIGFLDEIENPAHSRRRFTIGY